MTRTQYLSGIRALAAFSLLVGSMAYAQQSSSSNSGKDTSGQQSQSDADDQSDDDAQSDRDSKSSSSKRSSATDRSDRSNDAQRQSTDRRTSSQSNNDNNNGNYDSRPNSDQHSNSSNQTWSSDQGNQQQQAQQGWQHPQSSQQGWQQNQQPGQQAQQGFHDQQNNQHQPQGNWQQQQPWQQNGQNPQQSAQPQHGWQQQQYADQLQHQQSNVGQQAYGAGYGGSGYAASSQDPRMQQYQQHPYGDQNFQQAQQFQHGNQFQQGNQGDQQGYSQNQQSPALGVTLAAHATHGVVVTGVSEHTAASAAGLQPGDQIVAINGNHVFSNQDLIRAIHSSNGQAPLNLVVARNGQMTNLQAMLVPNHAQGWVGMGGQPLGQGFVRERPALGVTLHQNGPNDVRISNVFPGSPAQQAGLQPGDRILAISQQHVAQTDDVINHLAQAHPDHRVPIEVERNGQQGTIWTTPQEPDQAFQNQGVNR